MSAPAKQLDIPTTGEHKLPAARAAEAWWQRSDLLVVLGAVLLLAGGWLAHRALTRPRMVPFEAAGLAFRYPADFALRDPLVVPGKAPLSVNMRKPGDAAARLEVSVEPRRPMLGDAAAGRELARARRHGDHYERLETARRHVNGKDWLRTRFSYVSSDAGPATIVHAVEYAYPTDPSVSSAQSYLVTVHGTAASVTALEAMVVGSLRVR